GGAGGRGGGGGRPPAAARQGRWPGRQLIDPAVRLAEHGIPISIELAQSLQETRERMTPWPASMKAFFKPDGAAYQPGDTLIQPDLAASLQLIAEQGA
ncbi:MAG TPA: gamma-glutamyltransferase, partial [Candidatus Competibacter sp.]|nr:gamma-glutamyltransferase [Candidatus Competibacter sp.]